MQLKMQVQSERFVLMLAFMIDLHEVLKGVSECFQADKTTLADIGQSAVAKSAKILPEAFGFGASPH